MKSTLFEISILFLLISLILIGCNKDWEISPSSKISVIQKEVDGIEFKFCLLNEAGEATTVFNKGENFSFYFSVTNNSDKELNFDPNFAYSNENGFCRIYNSTGADLGKSFELLQALMIGPAAYPFGKNDSYIFENIWSDDRDSVWFWQKGTYESTHKDELPEGRYYTSFKHQFQLTGKEPIKTDTLSFRINFEIQ